MGLQKVVVVGLACVMGLGVLAVSLTAEAGGRPACNFKEREGIEAVRRVEHAAVRNFGIIKDRAEARIESLPADASPSEINDEIDRAAGDVWAIHKAYSRVMKGRYFFCEIALYLLFCPEGHSANLERNYHASVGWLAAGKQDCLDELEAMRP